MDEWLDVNKLLNWTKLAQQIVQTLAILIGGIWAYFKFIRGRTFASRAEVSVKGTLFSLEDRQIIKATVFVRNTGASKITVEKQGKVIRLYGAKLLEASAPIEWIQLRIDPIFESHGWIESQEIITEELLLPVSTAHDEDVSRSAYKLEALVFGKLGRFSRKGVKWSGDTIIPGEMKPAISPETGKKAQEYPGDAKFESPDGLGPDYARDEPRQLPQMAQERRAGKHGVSNDSEADNEAPPGQGR
jgi:hypothetical protein